MEYSLVAYNELTGNIIFQGEPLRDTKENMRHLNKLYDDFETAANISCKFIEHGDSHEL
tara:strand:+ start:30 stop:206 length:177 start_codon:yes stop_codon:yes gene_type:complete